MAALVRTVSSIADRIRRRCDQENSTFVSNSELYEEINASYAHLVDEVHDAADTEGLLTSADAVTTPGTDVYSVNGVYTDPDTTDQPDVYRVAGVDVEFDGRWRAIGRWRFTDRNELVEAQGWSGPGDTFYRIHNHDRVTGALQLRFFPTPQGAYNLRVWYLPIAPELASGHNVVALNGWDDFIVNDVCAKVLEKGRLDQAPLLQRRERALRRVIWAAANLDDSGVEGIREVVDWGTGGGRPPGEENSNY